MSHDEIVSRLTQLTENPAEVLFSITMQRVIDEIVGRLGIQALSLSRIQQHQYCLNPYEYT
jgi:hypothetical protein